MWKYGEVIAGEGRDETKKEKVLKLNHQIVNRWIILLILCPSVSIDKQIFTYWKGIGLLELLICPHQNIASDHQQHYIFFFLFS